MLSRDLRLQLRVRSHSTSSRCRGVKKWACQRPVDGGGQGKRRGERSQQSIRAASKNAGGVIA